MDINLSRLRKNIIQRLKLKEEERALPEPEARKLLGYYRINVPRFVLANSKTEAVSISKRIGYPVVLKTISSQLLHKSDAGGVKLNLKPDREVKEAYSQIEKNVHSYSPRIKIQAIMVEEMVMEGIESIVGMIKDPQFGQAVMFGLGGIFTEVLKDVSFRLIPLEKYDAYQMIKEIKGYPLLTGARGRNPIPLKSIVEVIMSVARLTSDFPQIKEIDLNPLILFPDKSIAVDARVILR